VFILGRRNKCREVFILGRRNNCRDLFRVDKSGGVTPRFFIIPAKAGVRHRFSAKTEQEYKMPSYRRYVTVQDPQHLVLSDLPVKVGQQVEVIILLKKNTQVINPAEAYTDTEWDKLEPDLRSELETRYILNNPSLMRQMQDQGEWSCVSVDKLGIF